ncbi:MAG: hypothetical protein BalsKO_01050 [Balneolaceae bacterium]
MKRIVKFISILAVALLISLPAFSQARSGDRGKKSERKMGLNIPPEVRSEAQIAIFDEYLDLSESQEDQIKIVDEELALKGKEIREEKVNRRKKMALAKELKDERQKAIHKILTKEQYAIYLDKKEAIQYDIRQRLKDHVKDGD